MKIQLGSDETLSSGYTKAGTVITITAANADECFALVRMHKAVLLDENAIAGTPGNVGLVEAERQNKLKDRGFEASVLRFPAGVAAGTVLGRLIADADPTLTDNAGGRFNLSGRTVIAGSTAMVAGSILSPAIKVGDNQPRALNAQPATPSTISAVPSNVVTFQGQPITFQSNYVTYGVAA